MGGSGNPAKMGGSCSATQHTKQRANQGPHWETAFSPEMSLLPTNKAFSHENPSEDNPLAEVSEWSSFGVALSPEDILFFLTERNHF